MREAFVLGTVVNAIAIVAGSLIGLLFRGGIPQAYNQTVMQAIGLAVILIGFKGALKGENFLLIILSLAIGAVLGEGLKIEARLERLGQWLQRRFAVAGDGIARGFVTASLLFCVGSMAIVGALESGLSGDHQTLFAKSVLDGITAIIFASTLGIGVIFSAAAVFLYQGLITLTASSMREFLVPETISQMTAVGGLLIIAIGINILEIKRIRVGNMLPAIFLPLAYGMLRQLWT
jgi:uncharacterized membrane protein YqgA involved in biofilm formation